MGDRIMMTSRDPPDVLREPYLVGADSLASAELARTTLGTGRYAMPWNVG